MRNIRVRRSKPFRVKSGRVVSKRGHIRRLDFPNQKWESRYARAAIIVPSTKHGTEPISNADFNKRILETDNFMRNKYGGTTRISGFGTFKRKRNKYAEEKNVMVESFHKPGEWKRWDKPTETWLRQKRHKWGQDSMAFLYESPDNPSTEMHFVGWKRKKKKK